MTTPLDIDSMTDPREARLAMRRNEWHGTTARRVPGYVQTNLVVLPKEIALDFLIFCQRNPQACPVVEVTEPGNPVPVTVAPSADLRTDLPRYAIFENGRKREERTEVRDLWQPDSVGFLIGSSLTFDAAMTRAGVEALPTVWVLRSTIPNRPAGIFGGTMIVTMRIMSPAHAIIATQLTARFPRNHGAPIHIGDPSAIGADLDSPIVGEPIKIPEGKIAVFWACGVTPQEAALNAKLPLMITHAPGHAFITDIKADQFCLP